jgi:hypothetical protein
LYANNIIKPTTTVKTKKQGWGQGIRKTTRGGEFDQNTIYAKSGNPFVQLIYTNKKYERKKPKLNSPPESDGVYQLYKHVGMTLN